MICYFKLSYFTQLKINTVFFPFKNFIPDFWFKIQNKNKLYDFHEVRLRDLTASCFLLQLAVIRCKWLRCKCPYSLSIYSSFEFLASKSQLYSLFYKFILVCQKSRLVFNISWLVSWFLAFFDKSFNYLNTHMHSIVQNYLWHCDKILPPRAPKTNFLIKSVIFLNIKDMHAKFLLSFSIQAQ